MFGSRHRAQPGSLVSFAHSLLRLLSSKSDSFGLKQRSPGTSTGAESGRGQDRRGPSGGRPAPSLTELDLNVNRCRRLRRLYADTLDAQIVLLACLPSANRTASFLALLTPATMSRLQRASLQLAFGERWRSKLADLAVGGDTAKTKD